MNACFSRIGSKQIFAALLAFWMSGAVLVLCCGAAHAEAKSEHCPLQKSHCDKSNGGERAVALAGTDAVECCRFPSAVFDKARKLEANSQAAQPSGTVSFAAPQFFALLSHRTTQTFYHAPLLNRGETYLKNRVFRI